MKTDTAAPARVTPSRAAETTPAGRNPARSGDTAAPADVFAQLLMAADSEPEAAPPAATAPGVPTTAPAASTADTDETPPDTLQGLALWNTTLTPPPAEGSTVTPAPPEGKGLRAEAAKPGEWVSTVAKAKTKSAPPKLLSELAQSTPTPTGQPDPTIASAEAARMAWHAAAPGAPGSRLSEALGEPDTIDLSLLATLTTDRTGGRSGDTGTGGRGPEAGRALLDTLGSSATQADGTSGASFDGALAEAMGASMADTFQALGEQVSLWAAGNTRKASLTLQTGLRDPLEVELSLDGDQAQLTFRTDDAAVREALRAYAQPVLHDMLNRAGLGLESLSVGERGAGPQQGESGSGERRGQAPGTPASARPDSVAESPRRLATLQGAGLSVYA